MSQHLLSTHSDLRGLCEMSRGRMRAFPIRLPMSPTPAGQLLEVRHLVKTSGFPCRGRRGPHETCKHYGSNASALKQHVHKCRTLVNLTEGSYRHAGGVYKTPSSWSAAHRRYLAEQGCS